MKFTVGDKVLLKQTGEEGEIIAFLGKTMLEVSVNGVQFPVFLDEVDHPYLKWFTDPKKPLKKKPAELNILPEKKPPPKLARSIYLSFMPVYRINEVEDIVDEFRIYLLNETATAIAFRYTAKGADGATIFTHSGSLHAFGHIFLHRLSFDIMSVQPRLVWELSEDKAKKKSTPQTGVLRIKPAKLFAHLESLLESGEPSFAYVLAEDVSMPTAAPVLEIPASISPLLPLRDSFPASEGFNEVIDLHAAILFGEGNSFTPAEILHQQIAAMEKHIDAAFAAGLSRVIIIHGIGSGALREAVQEKLQNDKRVEKFTSDWEGAFGYGATIATFCAA